MARDNGSTAAAERQIHPGAGRRQALAFPKGRQVDVGSLEEVRALLGGGPYQRDLLIEYLHLIQDATATFRRPSAGPGRRDEAAHGRGLRGGVLLRPLRYRAGRRGAASALDGPGLRQPDLRDDGHPGAPGRAAGPARPRGPRGPGACMGRCDCAPVARSAIATSITRPWTTWPRPPRAVTTTRSSRITPATRPMSPRAATGPSRPATTASTRPTTWSPGSRSRSSRQGRRRLSQRRQVEDPAPAGQAAALRDQRRRGRAGHLQGPLLPGARSPPLSRRHADRRLGRRGRGLLHLPARRVPGGPGRSSSRRSRGSRPRA